MQVMLEGEFTIQDLEELAKWLRQKEMKKPDKLFTMLLDKPTTKLPEAVKIVKNLMATTMEEKFGKYKKVVVEGKIYKVPTKDIVINGIKGKEVSKKYPLWGEEK